MKREIPWKVRIPIAVTAIVLALLVGRSLIVHATELPVPRRHAVSISVVMKRESSKPAKRVAAPAVINRPAGMP